MAFDSDDNFAQRIAALTAFLEAVGEDYEKLAALPDADRQRFLMAAGRVARPGPWEKRASSMQKGAAKASERSSTTDLRGWWRVTCVPGSDAL